MGLDKTQVREPGSGKTTLAFKGNFRFQILHDLTMEYDQKHAIVFWCSKLRFDLHFNLSSTAFNLSLTWSKPLFRSVLGEMIVDFLMSVLFFAHRIRNFFSSGDSAGL